MFKSFLKHIIKNYRINSTHPKIINVSQINLLNRQISIDKIENKRDQYGLNYKYKE